MVKETEIEEIVNGLDPNVQAIVNLLQETISRLEESLERLHEENAELKRLLFGKKAERQIMPSARRESAQRAKQKESKQEEEARKKKTQEERARRRGSRNNLPTIEETIPVAEQQKVCPHCDTSSFRPLGEGQVSVQYEYQPGKLVRKRIIREKLTCRCGSTVITAPPPTQVTEGSSYGPGLHAHVVVSKCADSLPFFRQSKQFDRCGVPLSRSTICDLFHQSAELLSPLHRRLLELVAKAQNVSADETRLPIQEEGGCRNGFVWTFLTESIVSYVYSATRSGETPRRILEQTSGTLQVDGYTGYNSVSTPKGRTRAGCWAHARREFFKSIDNAPDEAGLMLDLIGSLYDIEHQARLENIVGTRQHQLLRETLSKPIIEEIKKWLHEQKGMHPPKGQLSKAINYALNQWKTLTVFLQNPKVEIDNNASERALRIVALGRKNFLFSGHDAAAENLAILQTLVSTCQACKVNPLEYLADVLIRVQSHPASRVDELLPMNWKPPDPDTDSSTFSAKSF